MGDVVVGASRFELLTPASRTQSMTWDADRMVIPMALSQLRTLGPAPIGPIKQIYYFPGIIRVPFLRTLSYHAPRHDWHDKEVAE